MKANSHYNIHVHVYVLSNCWLIIAGLSQKLKQTWKPILFSTQTNKRTCYRQNNSSMASICAHIRHTFKIHDHSSGSDGSQL